MLLIYMKERREKLAVNGQTQIYMLAPKMQKMKLPLEQTLLLCTKYTYRQIQCVSRQSSHGGPNHALEFGLFSGQYKAPIHIHWVNPFFNPTQTSFSLKNHWIQYYAFSEYLFKINNAIKCKCKYFCIKMFWIFDP